MASQALVPGTSTMPAERVHQNFIDPALMGSYAPAIMGTAATGNALPSFNPEHGQRFAAAPYGWSTPSAQPQPQGHFQGRASTSSHSSEEGRNVFGTPLGYRNSQTSFGSPPDHQVPRTPQHQQILSTPVKELNPPNPTPVGHFISPASSFSSFDILVEAAARAHDEVDSARKLPPPVSSPASGYNNGYVPFKLEPKQPSPFALFNQVTPTKQYSNDRTTLPGENWDHGNGVVPFNGGQHYGESQNPISYGGRDAYHVSYACPIYESPTRSHGRHTTGVIRKHPEVEDQYSRGPGWTPYGQHGGAKHGRNLSIAEIAPGHEIHSPERNGKLNIDAQNAQNTKDFSAVHMENAMPKVNFKNIEYHAKSIKKNEIHDDDDATINDGGSDDGLHTGHADASVDRAPARKGNPAPSKLHIVVQSSSGNEKITYTYPKADKMDWNDPASIRRLNRWRQQVFRRHVGKTRGARSGFLKAENDFLIAAHQKNPMDTWVVISRKFNEAFAGKIIDGDDTVRPYRSAAALASQRNRIPEISDLRGVETRIKEKMQKEAAKERRANKVEKRQTRSKASRKAVQTLEQN